MSVELVFGNLAVQCIAMHAQYLCGLGLISTRSGQGTLNKFLFELAQGFRKVDAPFDHL